MVIGTTPRNEGLMHYVCRVPGQCNANGREILTTKSNDNLKSHDFIFNTSDQFQGTILIN